MKAGSRTSQLALGRKEGFGEASGVLKGRQDKEGRLLFSHQVEREIDQMEGLGMQGKDLGIFKNDFMNSFIISLKNPYGIEMFSVK